jgi:hypothetical protein
MWPSIYTDTPYSVVVWQLLFTSNGGNSKITAYLRIGRLQLVLEVAARRTHIQGEDTSRSFIVSSYGCHKPQLKVGKVVCGAANRRGRRESRKAVAARWDREGHQSQDRESGGGPGQHPPRERGAFAALHSAHSKLAPGARRQLLSKCLFKFFPLLTTLCTSHPLAEGKKRLDPFNFAPFGPEFRRLIMAETLRKWDLS